MIIPHGGRERLPHLTATLAALERVQGVGEILVVEMDTAPFAADVARRAADKYVFVPGEGAFHKARAMNAGVPLAEGDLLLWLDNDLLLPEPFLEKAVTELRARGLDCLVPWSSVRYLSDRDTAEVLRGARTPSECTPANVLHSRHGACGGASLVRKAFVVEHGGMCEEFRGWGGEDNAWFYKARLLGRAAITGREDQHLLHLFHERSGGYGSGDPTARNPRYGENVALMEAICAVRDPATFRERFPPPTHGACPWDPQRPLLFLTEGSDTTRRQLADEAAEALAQMYGAVVKRDTAGDGAAATAGGRREPAPEAVVLFGTGLGLRLLAEPSYGRLRDRTVVVHDAAGAPCIPSGGGGLAAAGEHLAWAPEACEALRRAGLRPWGGSGGRDEGCDGLRLARALVQPLSLLLGGDGRVSGVGCRVSADWEGDADALSGPSDTRHPTPDTLPSPRRSRRRSEAGVCIGVHVHSEPEQLLETLAHLRANTRAPHEMLLLPDGPDGATRVVLATLNDLPQLETGESRGAPACFNRLIAATEAEVVVLLESGALVGPGWLDHLLAALGAEPQNGLAGPSTNLGWNEQCVFPNTAATPEAIGHAAGEAAERFGGMTRTLEPLYSLADFCYAVRREVVDAIGGADEGYGPGPCWEMDYNIRAARAGFQGVWAGAAYVHRLPLTARRRREETLRLEANRRRYQDKFCALRLRGERADYEPHCRGEACEHFAPLAPIALRLPVPAAAALPAARADPPASEPLVSCIMPTYNRRRFVSQAIRYFLRQEYAPKELVIVDDGSDPVDDLIPMDARIRYLRLETRAALGQKRNLAVEASRGAVIAHWDDDDWYHPSYLARAAQCLAQSAEAEAVAGQSAYLVYLLEEGALRICRSRAIAGATFCYYRSLWEKTPYRDVSVAEDYFFLQDARPRQLSHEDSELFAVIRHTDHTWNQDNGTAVTAVFRRLPGYHKTFAELTGGDDCRFYESLRSELYTPGRMETALTAGASAR